MDNGNSFLTLFLAPVAAYLDDESVSEIMINGSTGYTLSATESLRRCRRSL